MFNRLIFNQITRCKYSFIVRNKIACGLGPKQIMNPTGEEVNFSKFGVKLDTQDVSKTVYVSEDLDHLKISFLIQKNGNRKTFNMMRLKEETLDKSLLRLKLNIEKFLGRKNRTDLDIRLEKDGHKLNELLKNIDAWDEGSTLRINDDEFKVAKNVPQVLSLNIPKTILANFPLIVDIKLENCDPASSKFFWFRSIKSDELEQLSQGKNDERVILYDKMYWYLVSEKLKYLPSDDDLFHKLVVVCIPTNGKTSGPLQYYRSLAEVLPCPTDLPYKHRQNLTATKLPSSNSFRVVSYNILANIYADSAYSREHLFQHCKPAYLEIDYRRLLLLNELEGYNADIICMQEVDKKEASHVYQPYFRDSGHESVFSEKGDTSEGLLTVVDTKKMCIVESHKTFLSQLISQEFKINDEGCDKDHFILNNRKSELALDCLSRFDEILNVIESDEEVKTRFLQRKTIIQTTLAKTCDNRYILIFNTHLYFAPDADHIRLLQGSVCLKYMEFMQEYYSKKIVNCSKIAVFFCGDMNSTPDCGLYKLITEGSIEENGLELKTKIQFDSAYKNIEYTNYTPLFNGCLDYIYYDKDNFNCQMIVPLPSHEVVTKTGGIPSDVFPSDHLALISDFKLALDV